MAHDPSYYVGRAIQAVRLGRLAKDGTSTQEHIAHESGVSLRHYQKIEAGGIDVRIGTLYAISAALGAKAQEILDRADDLRPKKK